MAYLLDTDTCTYAIKQRPPQVAQRPVPASEEPAPQAHKT